MEYAEGSCWFGCRRLSKIGFAGVKGGVCRAAAGALMGYFWASAAFAGAPVVNYLPGATASGYIEDSMTQDGGPLTSITGPGVYNFSDYFTSNGGGTWADGLCSPPSADCMFDSASGHAQVQMTPFPSLSLSVSQLSSIPNGGSETVGTATLSYDIEINGPTPYVEIDVSGWTAVNGPFQSGQGFVSIAGAPSQYYGTQSGDGTPVPYSVLLSEPTGVPIGVELLVSAQVDNGLPFASPLAPTFDSVTAYADPYFSIDPSNADPNAYTILVSPGVGNAPSSGVPGTPEASTWAMMLLGFVGLGFAGYRRAKAGPTTLARHVG